MSNRESGLKIGRFMVAAGAIIESSNTGHVLLMRRSDPNHHTDMWEPTYGRIDQFEDIDQGLKREIQEETGLDQIEIIRVLRLWHIFRGSDKNADTEVQGVTFHCMTNNSETAVKLSSEHSEYRWVPIDKALELVTVPGILEDLRFFAENRDNNRVAISGLDDQTHLVVNND